MTGDGHETAEIARLRRRAEDALQADARKAVGGEGALSPDAVLQALHELRVYQIELAMQNEELRAEQFALSAARERYFGLYDMAPVGYLTLGDNGLVLEANLTAAAMLGVNRGSLVMQPISRFIHQDDQDLYYLRRQEIFLAPEPVVLEVRMMKKGGGQFWAHLTAAAHTDAGGDRRSRIVITDLTERKQAEEALEQAHLRLKVALEAARAGTWEWDLRTNVNIWSDELWPLYGLRANSCEPTYETWLQTIHPDDRIRVAAAVQGASERGAELIVEWRVNAPGRPARWLMSRGQPQRDADGATTHYLGTVFDITERRRYEEVNAFLAEAGSAGESFFAALSRFLSERTGAEFVCVARLNPNGVVGRGAAIWSDGALWDVGESFGPLVHTPCRQISGRQLCSFPEQVCTRFPCEDVLRRLGAVSHLSVPAIGQNGVQVGMIAAVSRRPLTDHETARALMEVVSHRVASVLEREEAQATLRETEDLYRGVVENDMNAIVLMDAQREENGDIADFTIIHVNPAFERHTGRPVANMVGKRLNAALPFAMRAGLMDTFRQVTITGTARTFEVYSEEDGRLYRVTAYRAGRDRCASIFADITAQRRAEGDRVRLENQLQHAIKMESVGRLAGGVAHDFNNMLGVILGHTELAMMRGGLSPAALNDLEQIRSAAERSASLTRQLLAFARKETMAPSRLNLNESVAAILGMLKRIIGENIELDWRPYADLPMVLTDPTQIDQILANLCVNSRDAIAGAGHIVIETGTVSLDEAAAADNSGAAPGDYVWLSVADDGAGMSRETVARVFEPFFTTKDVGKGTGLGLATVYGAVQQSHGFITVESTLGVGTMLRIHLPCAAGGVEAPAEQATADPLAAATETILLVEDEPAMLEMTRVLLEERGYTVLAAGTPETAIATLSEHTGEIHLVITDVIMPRMGGRELADAARAIRPGIRTLYISGYAASSDDHTGMFEPEAHLVQKPFSAAQLAAKVRETLEHAPPSGG